MLVAIDDWPIDSLFPNGHLVRIIGTANDWQTEVECLLLKHHIFPRPFSAAAMGCLPIVSGRGIASSGDNSSSGSSSDYASGGSGTGHGTWIDSHWSIPPDTPLTDPSTVLDFTTIIHDNKLTTKSHTKTTAITTIAAATKYSPDHISDSINIPASSVDTAWNSVSLETSPINVTRTDLRQARRVFSVDPPGCQVQILSTQHTLSICHYV